MEAMSAQALATTIRSVPSRGMENAGDRGIEDMIDTAQRVWRTLRDERFEATRLGHVALDIIDESGFNEASRPDHIDGLDVRYVDPSGYSTKLGGIRRRYREVRGGAAYVHKSPTDTERLYPHDPRWDAVVGTIGRAIVRSLAELQR